MAQHQVTVDPSKYSVVFEGLNGPSPVVSWDTSLHSLEQAIKTLNHPETKDFLSKCFLKMINIYLDQYPLEYIQYRDMMNRTLELAMIIVYQQLKLGNDEYLCVLAQLFNHKRVYYCGNPLSRNFNRMSGLPDVRLKLLLIFFKNDGFKFLNNIFKSYQNKGDLNAWLELGADDSLHALLRGLYDILIQNETKPNSLNDEISEIAYIVQAELPRISESLVKTEGVDAITPLIFTLRYLFLLVENGEMVAFDQWTKLSLYFLKSSSLPLRLVACEQLEDIIKIANESLPQVEKYLVYGAGNDVANGIYELSSAKHSHSSMWTKVDVEKDLTMTMFLCGIGGSTKKYWYLSEADEKNPGGDGDIDYYKNTDDGQKHKKHAPLRGWITCAGAGKNLAGKEPPPMLQCVGGVDCPSDSKASLLIGYTLSSHVMDSVFGDSMHREVVARSSSLLMFLAKCNALNNEHIDLMWKACLRSGGEVELCNEILSVLADLCPFIKNDLLIHFLKIASDSIDLNDKDGLMKGKDFRSSLRTPRGGVGTINPPLPPPSSSSSLPSLSASSSNHTQGNVGPGIAMKLANTLADMKFISSLPLPLDNQVLDALLGFLWNLVSLSPNVWKMNKLKSFKVEHMTSQLLKSCEDVKHHMETLKECLSILKISSNTRFENNSNKSSRTTSSVNGRQSPHINQSSNNFEEDDILHTLSLTRLVLDNFPSPLLRRNAVDRLANENGLIELLSHEISAWRLRRSYHFPLDRSLIREVSPTPPSTPLPSNESNESPRTTLAATMQQSSLSKSSSNSSSNNGTTLKQSSKRAMNGPSNIPTPTIETLICELGARLDLFSSVYSASPKVSLGISQLSHVWKLLQLPEEKERCLIFFNEALETHNGLKIEESVEGDFFSCFGEEEVSFINFELLGKDTDWTHLGEEAYKCLRAFQATMMTKSILNNKEINHNLIQNLDELETTIEDSNMSDGLSLKEIQRIQEDQEEDLLDNIVFTDDAGGNLNVIWKVYLTTKSHTMANMAMLDLITIYNHMMFKDKLLNMQSQFLSRTIGYLEQSFSDLNQTNQITSFNQYEHDISQNQNQNTNWSGNKVNLNSVRLVIKRCIMILKASLNKSYGVMPIPHALKSNANMIPIKVSGRKDQINNMNKPSHVMNLNNHMEQQPSIEPFELQVHPLETIRSIRLKIRNKMARTYPIGGIILMYNGKIISNDENSVKDFNFFNVTHELKVICKPHAPKASMDSSKVTSEEMLLPPVEGMKHIGEIISTNDLIYNALFNLLKHDNLEEEQINNGQNNNNGQNQTDNSSQINDLPTSIAIWELLLTLPTQQSAESAILTCAHSNISNSWTMLFEKEQDNWHRIVYFLQICDSHLCRDGLEINNVLNTDMKDNDEMISIEGNEFDSFKKSFMDHGGLNALLLIFMKNDLGAKVKSQNVLIDTAAMTSLRILKECIFGSTSPTTTNSLTDEMMTENVKSNENVESEEIKMDNDEIVLLKSNQSNSPQIKLSIELISPLLERLINILLTTHDSQFNDEKVIKFNQNHENVRSNIHIDMFKKCLNVNDLIEHTLTFVTLLVGNDAETIAFEFFNEKSLNKTKKLIISLLVFNKNKKVRKSMKLLCLGCFKTFNHKISKWLVDTLTILKPNCDTCNELFNVLKMCFMLNTEEPINQISSDESLHENDFIYMAKVIVSKLLEISKYCNSSSTISNSIHDMTDENESSVCDSHSYENDEKDLSKKGVSIMLSGCLMLLGDILKGNHSKNIQSDESTSLKIKSSSSTNMLLNTELENDLVHVMINDFLFTLPYKNNNNKSSHLISTKPVSFHGGSSAINGALKLIEVSCSKNYHDLINMMNEINQVLNLNFNLNSIYHSNNILTSNLLNFKKTSYFPLIRKWKQEISTDLQLTSSNIKYGTGLLNQGCTCYMNSTLQQLFMIEPFRKLILEAEIKYDLKINGEKFTPLELCGCEVDIECFMNINKDMTVSNESERKTFYKRAKVSDIYNEVEESHMIYYDHGTNHPPPPPVSFNIFKGREGIETGKFYVIRKADASLAPTKVLKSDNALKSACHVLEQLQRTFIKLERTEEKYVNCRPFVISCNCMQLEFNVFQQNDAPEFYDKLMHKLEDALKLTNKFDDYMNSCFGMQIVNQSIPKECTHIYKAREKVDDIMKMELKVQGMDTIEESLQEFVKDELMDGDNKIEFENPNNSEETAKLIGIRRTCLSQLPNILVLHLKRFDLDYNTFQTVKLNNKMSFPHTLNMKPYTKVGMEERDAEILKQELDGDDDDEEEESHLNNEDAVMGSPMASIASSPMGSPMSSPMGSPQRRNRSNSSADLHMQNNAQTNEIHDNQQGNSLKEGVNKNDDEDFLYELRGVLIHAGGSQSGHYYSFSRDSKSGDWYKFDDEDVSLWNPEEMERECYGGNITLIKNDKRVIRELTASALMLFYDKVIPNQTKVHKETTNETTNGTDASSDENIANNNIDLGTMHDENDDNDEYENKNKKTKTEISTNEINIAKDEIAEEKVLNENVKDYVIMSGIEAYENEVYESNLKFRRLGYIFDPHLHDFLKNMLSGVSGVSSSLEKLNNDMSPEIWQSVMDSMQISLQDMSDLMNKDNESKEMNQQKKASFTPFSSNMYPSVPMGKLTALQLHVMMFCITFFIDIILHCKRDKDDEIKEWIFIIQESFKLYPYIASLFLHLIVYDEIKHETWCKDYLLFCNDEISKFAFISIIEVAIESILPYELNEIKLENDKVYSYHQENDLKLINKIKLSNQQNPESFEVLRENDTFSDDLIHISMSCVKDIENNVISEPTNDKRSSSIIVDFIYLLNAFISPQASKLYNVNYPSSSDAIFTLIKNLAEMKNHESIIRQFFISSNMITKLVYLLCGSKSPQIVQEISTSYNKFNLNKKNTFQFINPYEYHTNFNHIIINNQLKSNNMNLSNEKFETLLEDIPALKAIMSVLAIPHLERVSLLQNSNIEKSQNLYKKDLNHWFDQTLTQDALSTFQNIFLNYSNSNNIEIMSKNDLLMYMNYINDKPTTSTSSLQYIDNVLLKYGCVYSPESIEDISLENLENLVENETLEVENEVGLNVDGFTEFYKQLAIEQPKEVWRHLTSLGFRSDLTHPDVVSSTPSLESGDVLFPFTPSTSCALTSYSFYDILFNDSFDDYIEPLLIKLCKNEENNSIALINSILLECTSTQYAGIFSSYM